MMVNANTTVTPELARALQPFALPISETKTWCRRVRGGASNTILGIWRMMLRMLLVMRMLMMLNLMMVRRRRRMDNSNDDYAEDACEDDAENNKRI